MKVTSRRESVGFQPITLTITVESQEERLALLAYAQMANRTAYVPGIPSKDRKVMRDFLQMIDSHLVDPT